MAGESLTPSVRRGYALGSVATGTFGTVPGLLLLPYLTDTLGITALVAGIIVFAPKAWDVVLNPISGRISDRSTFASGRRRPFLLGGGLALAISFALLFAGPVDPPWLAGTYVVALFLLCATAYSFFQVPYVAMPAEMTTDYTERTRLMTWRIAILALAILLSGATAPVVVNAFDDAATGHRVMGLYIATIIALGALGAWRGTRGAPDLGASDVLGDADDGTLRDQLRLVRANPAFRRLLATFVLQSVGIGAMLAGVAYVADDLLDSPLAATVLFAAFVGPALIVTPAWERFARTHGKKIGYQASTALLLVGALALLTARLEWPGLERNGLDVTWLVYPAAAVVGVGYAGAQVFPLALLPDIAAADAHDSGHNRIGVYTGVWTAGETLGLAIGPGLFAVVLALGGYVSATTDVQQTGSALTAIALGFSVVPAVLIALSALPLQRFTDPRQASPTKDTDE